MGRIRRFREGFQRLTPQREYIYSFESGYFIDGFYRKGNFYNVKDWKRRKWSMIRKINHRNKKSYKWRAGNA